MKLKTMNMARIDRSAKSLSERLSHIKKGFQESKDALHNWVAEQNRLIDEEERQISLREESIDVDCDELADKSVVCANDDTGFNALIAAADRLLLSENREGT